jgi:predicted O-methyltransferase YrrM
VRFRDQISARLAESPVAEAVVQGVLGFIRGHRRLVQAVLAASGLAFGSGAVAAVLLGAESGPAASAPWTVLGLGLVAAALPPVALFAAAALKGYAHAVGAQARAEVEDQIWQLEEQRAKDIEARFASLQRDIADFEQRIAGFAYGPNRAGFQRFSRYLSMRQCDHLAVTWGAALGVELKPTQIAYFAHHIDRVEHNSIGRLATDIEAAVIRALVVWSVRGKTADVLEIGTLFGVGVAAIHEICRFRFDDLHLTVIDPLNGYYQAGAADILLNMPISLEVFEANMARAGIAPSDFTVIRGLSEDQAVIEKAAQRRYDVLVIDGDHSLLGVRRDLENYAPLIKPGGYIVFDDYGVPEWPDIQAFVENEVKPRKDLRFVGVGSRTAIYRVVTQVPRLKGRPEAVRSRGLAAELPPTTR